jgi:hypothetical protein
LSQFLEGRGGNCCWTEKGTCDWQFVERDGRLEEDPDPREPYKAKFDIDNPGAVVKLTS